MDHLVPKAISIPKLVTNSSPSSSSNAFVTSMDASYVFAFLVFCLFTLLFVCFVYCTNDQSSVSALQIPFIINHMHFDPFFNGDEQEQEEDANNPHIPANPPMLVAVVNNLSTYEITVRCVWGKSENLQKIQCSWFVPSWGSFVIPRLHLFVRKSRCALVVYRVLQRNATPKFNI